MNVKTNNTIQCTVALAGLSTVLDPEIGLNVVDLGLIYEINFDEPGKKVTCLMTLTAEFCPMGDSITTGVRESLQTSFTGYSAEVVLTFDPPWNFERISEEGKAFLKR
ncbi:MAG: metal-sulfur cluster assembly factor [Bacteroidia bacterium]|nr:metal-sulfur cluster assembly factor [Bacteroidia bacterium]